MKRILFLFVLAFAIISCSKNKVESVKTDNTVEASTSTVNKTAEKANQLNVSTEGEDALPMTSVSWNKPVHDFGTINEGDIVETTFTLTNTGDKPMVINNAKATCGCTVPKVEKNVPIAPGETTEIQVRFNSTGKPDKQTKTVTLTGNFPTTTANITAQVTPKAKPTNDAMGATSTDGHEGHNH